MAPTYFICDHCDNNLSDVLESETFIIENYGDYRVCVDCVDGVAGLLNVVREPEYYLFLKHNESGTREIFNNLEDMKKRLTNSYLPDFTFGIRKGPWKKHLKRSFLRQSNCGLTEKEIENSINKILKETPDTVIYLGWLEGPGSDFNPANTTEQVIREIENERGRLKAGDKPILIGDEYGITGYGREDIGEFRCLHWSDKFEDYDNLGNLEEALTFPQRRAQIVDITWGITSDFVAWQIEKNEEEIKKLVRKRNSLQDLQGAAKKTRN
jgi:hypothetical protein